MIKPLKVKTKGDVESMKTYRHSFSKLAVVGQSRNFDVRNLLTYQLTSAPLVLYNLDVSTRKTTKIATLSWIEEKKVEIRKRNQNG